MLTEHPRPTACGTLAVGGRPRSTWINHVKDQLTNRKASAWQKQCSCCSWQKCNFMNKENNGTEHFPLFFLSCLLSILLWKSIKFRLWGCQTLHLLALLGGFLLKIQNAFSVLPLTFSSLGQHWLHNGSALEFSVYTIGWSSVRSSIVLLNILRCWLIGVFYLSLQILVVDQNSQTTCEEN